jgi:hypothetical protein
MVEERDTRLVREEDDEMDDGEAGRYTGYMMHESINMSRSVVESIIVSGLTVSLLCML